GQHQGDSARSRDRLDEWHEHAGGRLRQAGVDDDRPFGSDDRRLADDPRSVARLEPVHAELYLGGGPPLPLRHHSVPIVTCVWGAACAAPHTSAPISGWPPSSSSAEAAVAVAPATA